MENVEGLPGFERLYSRVYMHKSDLPIIDMSGNASSSCSKNINKQILLVVLGLLAVAGFGLILHVKRRQSHKQEDSDLNS